jgi:hypothetical protein
MSKVQRDEICTKCGHTFHEHGWNIPVEESELGDHCDCKAMVGWYCPTCKKLLKSVEVHVFHIKDGICPETKATIHCPECEEEVFDSQCVCFNFKR